MLRRYLKLALVFLIPMYFLAPCKNDYENQNKNKIKESGTSDNHSFMLTI
ncbi:hypothetical protein J4714_12325 [Staphylococcus epidermidis]|nr:hypothetical protein [Staphylococcus epidermidis]MBO1996713.1 hypothetical protein [Staphylococcus epidermidis]